MTSKTLKNHAVLYMGLLFSAVFFLLAAASSLIKPINGIVTIPLPLSIMIFAVLLAGLIFLYWNSIKDLPAPKSKKYAELFIMLAAVSASLSDGFWIFAVIASVIIIAGERKNLKLRNPILYLWGLMVITAFASSFFAVESRSLAFGASFGILLYGLFFTAVYNQNFLKERGEIFLQNIGVLMSFSIISTVLFSLWHFTQKYTIDVLIFRFQYHTGYGNSYGMASVYGRWPTHSSAFLTIAMWALIGIRLYAELPKHRRYIVEAGIVFSLIGALATLSRNAFLFLVLSIGIALIVLIIKYRNKTILFITAGTAVFFAGVLAFFVSRYEKWYNLFMNPLQQHTIADRIAQYQFGIKHLDVNPVLGIGLMNFGSYYRRLMDNPHLPDYLHQLWLSIALETGIIGFAVFSALLFMIGLKIINNYRRNPKYIIFVIVFFAWIATGIFDNWLYFLWSSTLFMIISALGSEDRRI